MRMYVVRAARLINLLGAGSLDCFHAPELKIGSPVSVFLSHFLVRYVDARQLISSQPEIEHIPASKKDPEMTTTGQSSWIKTIMVHNADARNSAELPASELQP